MEDVIEELTKLYIKQKEEDRKSESEQILKMSKANLIKFSIKLVKTINNN